MLIIVYFMMNDVWSGMPGLGQGLDLSQTMDGSLEARSVS